VTIELDFNCNSTTFRSGPIWQPEGIAPIANGTRREVNEQEFVFYDDYWIRYYKPPAERKKRVNAAMLAGALFNRATDIFRTIVELSGSGVEVSSENELMQECGQCFKEALDLGKQVKHYSGQEGIDELWGEPFRAFSVPIESFYESRFIKIAQAMKNIDTIAEELKNVLQPLSTFDDAASYIDRFATAAKYECETMGEELVEYAGHPYNDVAMPAWLHSTGLKLIFDGKSLIEWIALARVPMPVSTDLFSGSCVEFNNAALSIKRPKQQSL